jgi:SAM-dependent methyltransferase
MTVRSWLGRVPQVRRTYERYGPAVEQVTSVLRPGRPFASAPPFTAVRLAYEVMLDREPDPVGWKAQTARLRSRRVSPSELVASIRCGEEFLNKALPGSQLGGSIHIGRCQFIRSLPAARRILDLGGTHLGSDLGAMVTLGYPYNFDELVIVDLPSDERHRIYRSAELEGGIPTPQGMVRYSYHSMADLSLFADGSIDLVYSGQSFEHVTPDDGATVLGEVMRVLRPGGSFALDTPNGRVTRMQQAKFIDPDHEVEYTWPQLRSLLEGAGFEIARVHGLNWVPGAAEGRFDAADAATHHGLHDAVEDCYVIAAVCRRP